MHPQARLDQFFTLSRPEIKDSDKFDPKAKKKAGAKAKPGAKKAKQEAQPEGVKAPKRPKAARPTE